MDGVGLITQTAHAISTWRVLERVCEQGFFFYLGYFSEPIFLNDGRQSLQRAKQWLIYLDGLMDKYRWLCC